MSSAELFLSALRAQGRITQEEYVAHTNHHHFRLVTVYVPTWRPNTAISKAFNTVGLVELILRHLKPAELLNAKGVCKGFRKIIATSPSIQADIFTRVSPRPSPSLPPYATRGLAISHVQVRGVPGISATFRFCLPDELLVRICRLVCAEPVWFERSYISCPIENLTENPWALTTAMRMPKVCSILWACQKLCAVTAPFVLNHFRFTATLDLAAPCDKLLPLLTSIRALSTGLRLQIQALEVTVEMTRRAEVSALVQWAFLWSSAQLLGVGARRVLQDVIAAMDPWRVDRVQVTFKVHPENEVALGFRHTTFMDGEGSMKVLLGRVKAVGFRALEDGNGTLEGMAEAVLSLLKSTQV
ncbi:hypothetical protein LTR49_027334 [Elasticomyces elasticus]|nr:hypothetical protein LTR49_027334 [Elasticomyces elasticus]